LPPACLIATKNVWIATDQTEPLDKLLDQAMSALTPTEPRGD
jgi:hypothetical protein